MRALPRSEAGTCEQSCEVNDEYVPKGAPKFVHEKSATADWRSHAQSVSSALGRPGQRMPSQVKLAESVVTQIIGKTGIF